MASDAPASAAEMQAHATALEALRRELGASLGRRQLVEALRDTDLLQRLAVVDACARNTYQPASTGVLLSTSDHLQISLTEEVSRQIFLYGGYEEALTLALAAELTPGRVFFDVGAHYGYHAVLASHLVGWRGRVVAFEPTPATAKVLRNNLSGRQNCEVVEKAVWRRSGPLTFHDAGPALSAFNSVSDIRLTGDATVVQTAAIEVEAITLDEYVRQSGVRPDVVKLDVESAEMDALLGAEELLRTFRPVLTIEVGDFEHLAAAGVPTSRQVLLAVVERGYELYEATMEGLRPHALRGEGEYGFDNIVAVSSHSRNRGAPR